jgi:phage/plasmid-associated DNA primase
LVERLAEELPGILNRCIEGYCRLQRRGRFKVPAYCEWGKRRWIAQSNPLKGFIQEHIEVTGDREDLVKGSNIREGFEA